MCSYCRCIGSAAPPPPVAALWAAVSGVSGASASQSIAAPAPNPTLRLWCDGDGQGRIVSDIDLHLKFAPAICLILNQLAVASVGQICPTPSG